MFEKMKYILKMWFCFPIYIMLTVLIHLKIGAYQTANPKAWQYKHSVARSLDVQSAKTPLPAVAYYKYINHDVYMIACICIQV